MPFSYDKNINAFRDEKGRFIPKSRGMQSSIVRKQFETSFAHPFLEDLNINDEIEIGKPESPNGTSIKKRLSMDKRLAKHKTKTNFIYSESWELGKKAKHFDVIYEVKSENGVLEIKHFIFRNSPKTPRQIKNPSKYFGKALRKYILPTLNAHDNTNYKYKKVLYWKISHADIMDFKKMRKSKVRGNKKGKSKR